MTVEANGKVCIVDESGEGKSSFRLALATACRQCRPCRTELETLLIDSRSLQCIRSMLQRRASHPSPLRGYLPSSEPLTESCPASLLWRPTRLPGQRQRRAQTSLQTIATRSPAEPLRLLEMDLSTGGKDGQRPSRNLSNGRATTGRTGASGIWHIHPRRGLVGVIERIAPCARHGMVVRSCLHALS